MKFPSLLKTATNKRFSIQPRYYDPVKEDIEYRTDRIKRMMNAKEIEGESISESGIQGSFSRDSYYKQQKPNALRFSIMILLAAGAIGYLFYGNSALYIMMSLIVAYYLYKKIRPRFQ